MLERISARFSRKHIKPTSAAPLRMATVGKAFEPADRHVPPSWLSERSGEVRTASHTQPKQARIQYSMVGYQALDPYGDAHILEVAWTLGVCRRHVLRPNVDLNSLILSSLFLQVDSSGSVKHLFAAVISASRTAQGGNFLRRNMHRELLHQIKVVGDVHKAIRAAIFSLDRTWRDMHPFNRNVLDGVSLSAAYVDLSTNILYLASTGACRVVVGSRNSQGEVQVAVDVGNSASTSGHSGSTPGSLSSGIATVQLTETVDTIVLGSQGLWCAPASCIICHLVLSRSCALPHILGIDFWTICIIACSASDTCQRSLIILSCNCNCRAAGHLQSCPCNVTFASWSDR